MGFLKLKLDINVKQLLPISNISFSVVFAVKIISKFYLWN